MEESNAQDSPAAKTRSKKIAIAPGDIEELLALMPKTRTELVSMQRYGSDPWEMIEKVRLKIEELIARE